MKTWIYVDGFNLYYGALKGTPYKWLDPVRLATLLLPQGHIVDRLRYFTALVSGKSDPAAPARQRVYLNALSALPKVHVHYGRFLAKTAWRPLTNLPVAERQISTPDPVTLPAGQHPILGGQRQVLPVGIYPDEHVNRRRANAPVADALIAEFYTMEEKGSDVNLASYLLNDAWKASFDAAVVISNDTDLVTPIRMVSNEQGKPVFVVCPRQRRLAPPTGASGESRSPCPACNA